jgi:cobalt-zinc-cadmium resistance protein CzcA
MTRIRLIILGVLSMAFASMYAQNESWSLQQCIDLALDNSLYMRNGQIAVGKAKDLQGTAFDIEKTSISLSQDPTSGGSPDNGITISQTFDFPTVYIRP